MPEGIGHSHFLAVIPAIAHEVFLCIVGNELLTTVIIAVAGQVDEDIPLIVVLYVLRIGASGIGRHIFQFPGPGHRQLT